MEQVGSALLRGEESLVAGEQLDVSQQVVVYTTAQQAYHEEDELVPPPPSLPPHLHQREEESPQLGPPLPPGVRTSWPCPICVDKSFPSERALTNHRVKAHKEKLIPTCEVCSQTFPNSSRLGAHRRKEHPEEAVRRAQVKKFEGSIICGVCRLTFSSMAFLCEHLISEHGEPAHLEQAEFTDWAEFEAWKLELENVSASRFVRKQGSVIPTKFSERHYFDCHRSGKMRMALPREKRITHRANNLHPTRKIGFQCSAHLYVSVGNEMASSRRVSVVFCRHHYGHDRAPHWLPIPDATRERIQSLLSQQWTREEIFQEIQREAREASAIGASGADRLALISRHDIANIEKQLELRPEREARRKEKEEARKARQEAENARIAQKEEERAARRLQRLQQKHKSPTKGFEGISKAAGKSEAKKEKPTPRPQSTAEARQLRRTTRSGRVSKFGENMRQYMAWESNGAVIPPPEPAVPKTAGRNTSDNPRSRTVGGRSKALQAKLAQRRRLFLKAQRSGSQGKNDRFLIQQLRDSLTSIESSALVCGGSALADILAQAKALENTAEAAAARATAAPPPASAPPVPEPEEQEELVQMKETEPQPEMELEVVDEEVEVGEPLLIGPGLRLTAVSAQPITVQALIDPTAHPSQPARFEVVDEEVEVGEPLLIGPGLRLTAVSAQPITVQALIDPTAHPSQPDHYARSSGGFV